MPFTVGEPVVWSVREPPPAGPDEDGLPPPVAAGQHPIALTSAPAGSTGIAGYRHDSGKPFETRTGFGWDAPMSGNSRRRNVFRDEPRDTFLFTRSSARWRCTLENGKWEVTVCIGDANHPQQGQRVRLNGAQVIEGVGTTRGRFHEVTTTIEVRDGRLTVELGPQAPGNNTCLNWIQLVRRTD